MNDRHEKSGTITGEITETASGTNPTGVLYSPGNEPDTIRRRIKVA